MPSVIRIPTNPTPAKLVKPKIRLHKLISLAIIEMQRIATDDERYKGMQKLKLSSIAELTSPIRWGIDCKCVRWRGKTYHFSPEQASIVRVLRKMYEQGTPRIKVERLKQLCNSDAEKLPDVFRVSSERHPAMGEMIHLEDGWWWLA